MKLPTEIGREIFEFDTEQFFDISIPLRSGAENPKCFYADDPQFQTIRQGDFIGSVMEGGAVNFQKALFTPHGNGTHTECYGHISAEKEATISKIMHSFIVLAELKTVEPRNQGEDLVIQESHIQAIDPAARALIIRTLPNLPSKKTTDYSGTNPPYFSSKFMEKVVSSNIEHFLTDLPSVDREVDGGALSCHRIFWNGPNRKACTITELIHVPDDMEDGVYLLNLQVPNFALDAAPSRPILFPATKV